MDDLHDLRPGLSRICTISINSEILKIYEPRFGIACEKRGQTLFFDPSVTRDLRMV